MATSVLPALATKASLSDYALKSSLNDYTKTSSLSSVIFPSSSSRCIKFIDGHMIQWMSVSVSTTVTQAWGGMYYSSSKKSFGNWDVAFSSDPYAIVQNYGGGTGMVIQLESTTKTSIGSAYIYSAGQYTSSTVFRFTVIGFGRWKE